MDDILTLERFQVHPNGKSRLTGRAFMNTAKYIYFWMIVGSVAMAASNAHADTVYYTLDNVILDDNTQMTGTFSWTFDNDFENGVGQFSSLVIPWTSHDQDDLDATIDVTESIEITLEGSVHDDGVDIMLVLSEPLTPTTSSLIDLAKTESKYSIGGNSFHDGFFLSGSISPIAVPEPSAFHLFLSGLAVFGFVTRRRRSPCRPNSCQGILLWMFPVAALRR
jgi:hypothetical protein